MAVIVSRKCLEIKIKEAVARRIWPEVCCGHGR